MKNQYRTILLLSVLVVAAAVLRVLNAGYHFYNLVPVTAMGLVCGSALKQNRYAYLIPLSAMLLSDIGLSLFTSVQGFYGISQWVNYLALVLVTRLGVSMKRRTILPIIGYTICGSFLFFLLSNAGTFLSGYYGYTREGLFQCYLMAIPFYRNELATSFFVNSFSGDLIFSFTAFGLLALNSYKQRYAANLLS